MEFEIEVSYGANLLKQGWDVSGEFIYYHDFSEKEMKILTEHFQNFGPEDDVDEAAEEYLSTLEGYIFMEAVETILYDAIFEGKTEDLLQYIYQEYGISPIEIVEMDIKNGLLIPPSQPWNLIPESELIAQWCELHREDYEHQKYHVISGFFRREYNIYTHFEKGIGIGIYFPQELYDEIKSRKTE